MADSEEVIWVQLVGAMRPYIIRLDEACLQKPTMKVISDLRVYLALTAPYPELNEVFVMQIIVKSFDKQKVFHAGEMLVDMVGNSAMEPYWLEIEAKVGKYSTI
jgi:hypothetical protein